MKLFVAVLSGMLVAGVAVAEPLNLADVAGDAKWVFHFDWEKYNTTAMHQFAKTMPAREKTEAKMAEVTGMLGFNPLEDIGSITAYGASFEHGDGAMIVRGVFDPSKTIALMQKSSSYATEAYGSYTIHTWTSMHGRRNKKGACAFYDGGTAVLSKTTDAVKSALDVLNAKAPSLQNSPEGIRVPELSKDVIVMAYADKVEMGQHPKAAIFRNMDGLTVAVAETDGTMLLEAHMDAGDAQQAVLIQNAVSGMLAFGMLRAAENPAMTELLTAMKVSVEGDMVKLSFAKASEELMAVMIEQMENGCHQWKARHGKMKQAAGQ